MKLELLNQIDIIIEESQSTLKEIEAENQNTVNNN
jgi:hypothetical protein